jgi:ferrous-iron efflux pump FieF
MTNARWVRLASYASVATAITLIIIKLVAWIQTDSVSILASLLDSALDGVASIMIAVAVIVAQIPADKEHRFGHGKAEPLAALAQSIFISGSAFYLIVYSIDRLFNLEPIQQADDALLYMTLTLVLTLVLISFQHFVIAKTGSTAIRADSLHYISDVATNIAVIVALYFSYIEWLDPVLGLIIAVLILKSAFNIAKDSGNQLLDHELSEDVRLEIQKIILSTPEVKGFNDLRTYQSGPKRFIQFDLELEDELTLRHAHNIAEEVTKNLKAFDASFDVMIHQEPISMRDHPEHHRWGQE